MIKKIIIVLSHSVLHFGTSWNDALQNKFVRSCSETLEKKTYNNFVIYFSLLNILITRNIQGT